MKYDAIVVGTGFGATVAAVRLVEKGKRVLLLERGTWWLRSESSDGADRAAEPVSSWVRDNGHPVQHWSESKDGKVIPDFIRAVRHKYNKAGLYKFSRFKQAYVLTASGVGGGSLIYSNVNSIPLPEVLQSIGLNLNAADFQTARAWMETYRGKFNHIVTKVPLPGRDVSDLGEQDYLYLDRSRALKEAAAVVSHKLGIAARWKPLDLSIIEQDTHRGADSESARANTFCDRQGRCILGCLPGATHSLNKTLYARLLANPQSGATLWPLAEVQYLKTIDGGYEVSFLDHREDGRLKTVSAPLVFLGAGTLGTNAILLRSRDKGGLPLSDKLGTRFSTNGNFSGFAVGTAEPVNSTVGPINTCGIQLKYDGYNVSIEDAGIPQSLAPYAGALLRAAADPVKGKRYRSMLMLSWTLKALPDYKGMISRISDAFMATSPEADAETASRIFFFNVAAEDDASGVFRFSNNRLSLDWPKPVAKHPVFETIETLLRNFSDAMGGRYTPFPLWNGFADRKLMIVHPLGGCPVGSTSAEGVVDEFGRVFDASKAARSTDTLAGLYIVDGSVIPGALATNPVLTIAAQAIKTVAAAVP